MLKDNILSTIDSIEDFKRVDESDYPVLAREIRAFLIDSVSKHGGHLASNLGAVELTIALHNVFSSPKDSIIFDVGHQSYVHKLLTGRRCEFDTLRTKGGLGGFPKRRESEHDMFDTGHASTSVSSALGILRAKRLTGDMSAVVAVIGDGAMTGGMSFEALNDAGQSQLPLIVVLNDNEMSISGNVGALSSYFSNLRASKRYRTFKRDFEKFLVSIPKIGRSLAKQVHRSKNRIKYFLMPKNVWFEAMGFTYLGPIDGHDTDEIIDVLRKASKIDSPVLVHVITQKGKGYAPAEIDPEKFHGIGCFDPDTGIEINNKAKSNSEVFGETLVQLASNDERIVAVTAAMPQGTGLFAFEKKYPDRFFDVGIAEQHAVTMAAGMATAGIRPVVAIYSSFLQRAYDQILHDVCLQNLPVIFGVDRAGLVGEDGETHQGVYDIAYLLTMPNIVVCSPATKAELKQMLCLALGMNAPVAIRYGRGALPEGDESAMVEYGKWEIIRPLSDIVVIASGRMLKNADEASRNLEVGLVNARFIRPFDADTVRAVNARAKCIITVEDGIRTVGMGAYLRYSFDSGKRVINLGAAETPVEHATLDEQDESCGISAAQIRKVIEANL